MRLALAILLFAAAAGAEGARTPLFSPPVPPIYGFGTGATGCGPGPMFVGCDGYEITSTANSGAGTLRDFFSTGNRYVASCTANGTVTLTSNLSALVSNWTLDLGGCPNQGLQFTGAPIKVGSDSVHTTNWIIENLRSRLGDGVTATPLEILSADTFAVSQSSLQYGGDSSFGLSAQGPSRSIYDGTIQHSIIGPTLGCDNAALGCYQGSDHSEASLVVGTVTNITFYRNLIGNGGDDGRNPRFAPCGIAQSLPPEANTPGGTTNVFEMVENYIFGSHTATKSWPDQDCALVLSLVRNVVGESTRQIAVSEPLVDQPFDIIEVNMEPGGTVQVYAQDNMIHGASAPPADPCDLLAIDGGVQSGVGSPLCDTPAFVDAARDALYRLPSFTAQEVVDLVLKRAGARKPCLDELDRSIIAAVRAGTGIWIEEGMAEAGALPNLTDNCGS